MDLFGIVVAIVVQNTFHLEMYQNNFIFIFLKIIFNISISKRSMNI
jgi:hypothetical protein